MRIGRPQKLVARCHGSQACALQLLFSRRPDGMSQKIAE